MSDALLAAQTDICVKCGLCLPHCPTYQKTQDENESPRGRLSLIQGWARDELQATPKLNAHIDNCLLCRSCESVCPAYVPYGQIVDQFRSATHSQDREGSLGQRLKKSMMRSALTGETLAPLAGRLMGGAAAGAVKALASLTGAGEMAAGLPSSQAAPLPPPGTYPPSSTREKACASLHLGCTAELLDRETVASAMAVMNRLGIRVDIPVRQTCCGALDQHAGDTPSASEHIEQNLTAFESTEAPAIVSFASGCGGMLSEYGKTDSSNRAGAFSQRVRDISQFFAEQEWPDELALKPLPTTVCLHSPCSLRNVLRADQHPASLLKRIPGLKVIPLPAQIRCCGAAGSYMVDHPEMAAALRDDALDLIAASQPSLLLTSNPGCAMHLRAGLKQRGLGDIEVIHPVTLLARQLP
ncbi:MAG: (Fe-S)-binding protein [Methylococcaceae bacterium]|nr:(Fe-S)-binding protein [Methylococcaceae bacterium]